MSVFLLNAMNALAARFAPGPARSPQEYIDAAWTLAMPLMRLPTRDIAAGFLLLAWAEFGEVDIALPFATSGHILIRILCRIQKVDCGIS